MLKSEIKRVLGLMSGTSFDGVDAAVLETNGEVIQAFGETAFRRYSEDERAALRAVMGCWPDAPEVEVAAEIIETAHAEVMAQFDGVELAGFHGQTLAHEPRGRGTHQAGSGAVLAMVAGYPVVWDFRTSDVKLGGQGAPLAPFYHFALAHHIKADAPVVFLNLGGVGNLTWVDPRKAKPEEHGALLAFDTGPANAPMDDLCHARLGRARDDGGALAARGTVDQAVVNTFLQEAFFFRIPPKSLDRGFADMLARVDHLNDNDALATLSECCAASVGAAFDYLPEKPAQVLVCGGGRHNTDLMARIAAHLPCPVHPVEAEGLDGDMIEAQAFAFLAMRVARGLPTSCPSTTGVAAAVGGGQISTP